jgi:hypothetical protein
MAQDVLGHVFLLGPNYECRSCEQIGRRLQQGIREFYGVIQRQQTFIVQIWAAFDAAQRKHICDRAEGRRFVPSFGCERRIGISCVCPHNISAVALRDSIKHSLI